ncbi:MAG: hypothetical protein E7510_01885 [Ruminococcus sp.]|nr:hypothetical protein [Ruminococcus sp.]
MDNNFKTIGTIVKKEIIDCVRTLKFVLLAGMVCFNICMYATETTIFEMFNNESVLCKQLGINMMYLAAMSILFLGSALVNKLTYEEKKNKTIHMLLSMGIPTVTIWISKMIAIVIMCAVYSILNLAIHVVFLKIISGHFVSFTMMSAVMTFITIPILCYGFLFIVSIAFMYFSKMNVIGMLIQIVPYLGVWEISQKLIEYTTIPTLIVICSFGIGFVLMFISAMIVRKIPKEKIVTRVD